jgi:hypothetical protein
MRIRVLRGLCTDELRHRGLCLWNDGTAAAGSFLYLLTSDIIPAGNALQISASMCASQRSAPMVQSVWQAVQLLISSITKLLKHRACCAGLPRPGPATPAQGMERPAAALLRWEPAGTTLRVKDGARADGQPAEVPFHRLTSLHQLLRLWVPGGEAHGFWVVP